MKIFDRFVDPHGVRRQIANLLAASQERERELAEGVRGELDQLDEIRKWMASYPADLHYVSGDPETMFVARLRSILGAPGGPS